MAADAFLLDLTRCLGCQACVAACKTGNELPAGTRYIHIGEITRGSYPDVRGAVVNLRCLHCADAACIAVCPTGALFKEDGLTRVNRDACSACGYCVTACPFDIPELIDQRVSKCDGCPEVIRAGGTPWCVKTCPAGALLYGSRAALLEEAHRRAERIRFRFPRTRVYGESESGGLGVILLLSDEPESLGLPAAPRVSGLTTTWQEIVQPAGLGLTGLGLLATAAAAIFARRAHAREMEELEAESTEILEGSADHEDH